MSSFKTPILFLIFNRSKQAEQVFSVIKKIKPEKLYIASDGPRDHILAEKNIVDSLRNNIYKKIDWDCEIKLLYRDKNLGCKLAVSSALNWFFENEDLGIVLEDDCLPHLSFFKFCEDNLNKYKDDDTVGLITGTNFNSNLTPTAFLSKHPIIWGWATWRDKFRSYDIHVELKKPFFFKTNFTKHSFVEKIFWLRVMFSVKYEKINTWDYHYQYFIRSNNQLCIVPNINLINNIGFDSNSTHTKNLPYYIDVQKACDNDGEIKIGENLHTNMIYDEYVNYFIWKINPINFFISIIKLSYWRITKNV